MKKIIKTILSIFILMFTFFSIFNYALAVDSQAEDETPVAQTSGGQITTTVSSTSSADEGLLSPSNIINILLIAVGLVIIFLAIAILTRLKKR